MRLKLFETLLDGPLSPGDLGARFGLSEAAARRLLDAAASLDLAARRAGGRSGLDITVT